MTQPTDVRGAPHLPPEPNEAGDEGAVTDERAASTAVEGYGRVSRLFHWGMALLIATTVPVGIAMTSQGFEGVSDGLYITHKGLGVIIGVVLLGRIGWRLLRPGPPLPDSVPARERSIASATHVILYVLLLVMVVTGYVRTVGDGFPIELLNVLGVPPLVPEMPSLARTLAVVHKVTAYVLVALVAVHVSAVAHHALILGDGLFKRMWPPWGRS